MEHGLQKTNLVTSNESLGTQHHKITTNHRESAVIQIRFKIWVFIVVTHTVHNRVLTLHLSFYHHTWVYHVQYSQKITIRSSRPCPMKSLFLLQPHWTSFYINPVLDLWNEYSSCSVESFVLKLINGSRLELLLNNLHKPMSLNTMLRNHRCIHVIVSFPYIPWMSRDCFISVVFCI